jgi:hypothetical protein
MNARGISAIVLGWWVVSQVLLGGALDRLHVFGNQAGAGGSGALTRQQLGDQGLTTPSAKGRKSPPLTGPGSKQMWIQGSDGLWYPATPKVGNLKVTK